MNDELIAKLITELTRTAPDLRRLTQNEDALGRILEAYEAGDARTVRSILEELQLVQFCTPICRWLCYWHCLKVCRLLCREIPVEPFELADLGRYSQSLARLADDEEASKQLVEAVSRQDADTFYGVLNQFELQPFCFYLCYWICHLHCRRFCYTICSPAEPIDEVGPLEEFRQTAAAAGKLAENEEALKAALEAVQSGDFLVLQELFTELELIPCIFICRWICLLYCFRIGLLFCDSFPRRFSARDFGELLVGWQKLVANGDALRELVDAYAQEDRDRFNEILESFELRRYCFIIFRWICGYYCFLLCRAVCQPRVLIGEIDTPTANDCVESVGIAACVTDGAPLVGIPITGSAEGLPFDHYTLRYSWGGNPPINDAVVYPDCSRPPASTQSNVAVSSGTLGYLDVTLLPPGVTEFDVYLDVFDAAAGVVSDTTTFQLKTTSVEITEAATVFALDGEDPFHPGTFTKLIKATNDSNPAVPELSIGGSFSVTGSAYTTGCDRIMTQFVLVHFDAPPANPVPDFPDAAGGTQLLSPVVYADSPDHPWQSGCVGNVTTNIILNGNIVARWIKINCTFLGFDYQVDKVNGTTWDSSALTGRYVILLETRDRLVASSTFPGAFAAKDQVAVWIDNQTPTAKITSIGGIAGCGDLRLSDFVGTTAEVRGIAWDPPIDATAPQQAPNENFGSYSLGFQKNGGGSGNIPAATPNTRVPNIWPGPLAPADEGLLANWDIVAALDGGAGPLPAGSEKLERGTRCAYVLTINVVDQTHVGDSGNHNHDHGLYAINIINDL